MKYNIGDRVTITEDQVWNRPDVLLGLNTHGTIVAVPSGYEKDRYRILLDNPAGVENRYEWWFPSYYFKLYDGHDLMADPEISLDEIHAFEELL
jgi:hypothetical protein